MKEEQYEQKLYTKDEHRHHQVEKEYLGGLEYCQDGEGNWGGISFRKNIS